MPDATHTTDINNGLTAEEAGARLNQHGPNKIQRERRTSPLKLLLEQFSSPLVLILIAAAGVSWGIGFLPGQEPNTLDAVLIAIIVILSAFLGFFQNYRAEKTIESLRKMAAKTARVIRDGKLQEIPLKRVVPGDVVVVQGGDVIPADAIVKEATRLSVNEAPLTGESEAVHKDVDEEIYMNTYVYGGEATAVVQHTGMDTKVGEIASELSSMKDEASPFDEQVSALVRKISVLGGVLIAIVLVAGLFRFGIYQSLLTAISLAVAAIPEGLPAIITLTLALGARAMSKKNALIRKMSVTESIGTVDVICTDKTGTLTKNEMTVTTLWHAGEEYAIDSIEEVEDSPVRELIRAGVLCNAAKVGTKNGKEQFLGDATETASLKLGAQYNITQEGLTHSYEHVSEVPFNSERKRSSHLYRHEDNVVVYTKGAPEVILERCTSAVGTDDTSALTEERRSEIHEQVNTYAQNGLRVLAFAYRQGVDSDADDEDIENDLVFIGLQAMIDPPHEGIEKAIEETRTAGITTLMLTGDNPLTAQAIATQVGLQSTGVLTGKETEELEDGELLDRIQGGTAIFARVSPFHKLRILKLLRNDHRVAMTGDGVNDVLAIKRADVGIAMGQMGTEVAKEASDIVLMDDNYKSIVAAVREGRRIFDNVRKFINYLFVSNIAEILVIFILTLVMSLEEPVLLPLHILWINLLTDGAPALALGADPARRDIMQRPPRKKGEPIVDRRLGIIIGGMSILYTVFLLVAFFGTLHLGVAVASTTLFTGFIIFEFMRIGIIRQQEELGWFANPWLAVGIGASFVLQLGLLYTPLNSYFHVVPLGWYPWVILAITSVIGFLSSILLIKGVYWWFSWKMDTRTAEAVPADKTASQY